MGSRLQKHNRTEELSSSSRWHPQKLSSRSLSSPTAFFSQSKPRQKCLRCFLVILSELLSFPPKSSTILSILWGFFLLLKVWNSIHIYLKQAKFIACEKVWHYAVLAGLITGFWEAWPAGTGGLSDFQSSGSGTGWIQTGWLGRGYWNEPSVTGQALNRLYRYLFRLRSRAKKLSAFSLELGE